MYKIFVAGMRGLNYNELIIFYVVRSRRLLVKTRKSPTYISGMFIEVFVDQLVFQQNVYFITSLENVGYG